MSVRSLYPFPSPNFSDRPEGIAIDTLVMHYSAKGWAGEAFQHLTEPNGDAGVSAHYFVVEDGTVIPLVPEEKKAWHAGDAYWLGANNINSRSIGIELYNPGHRRGYIPFPDVQIEAALTLAKDIVSRHAVPPQRVLGHGDIAPWRKDDPGELFPWRHFAQNGVGLWPDRRLGAPNADMKTLLSTYGYDTRDMGRSVLNFQRHFRQDKVTGVEDEECRVLADALCRQVGRTPQKLHELLTMPSRGGAEGQALKRKLG